MDWVLIVRDLYPTLTFSSKILTWSISTIIQTWVALIKLPSNVSKWPRRTNNSLIDKINKSKQTCKLKLKSYYNNQKKKVRQIHLMYKIKLMLNKWSKTKINVKINNYRFNRRQSGKIIIKLIKSIYTISKLKWMICNTKASRIVKKMPMIKLNYLNHNFNFQSIWIPIIKIIVILSK